METSPDGCETTTSERLSESFRRRDLGSYAGAAASGATTRSLKAAMPMTPTSPGRPVRAA